MSYQFSYSFDERVCGPVAMYEPVDPSMSKTTPCKYKFGDFNQLDREYDGDDSYQL